MFVYVCSANFSPSIWLILRPFVYPTVCMYVPTNERYQRSNDRTNVCLSGMHTYVQTDVLFHTDGISDRWILGKMTGHIDLLA